MITEQQEEQAALFALGLLGEEERRHFAEAVRADRQLRELLWSLQRTADKLALATPAATPPPTLKDKVLKRIAITQAVPAAADRPSFGVAGAPGFLFHGGADPSGWKQLPVRGAWIKLLSLERGRGYAVLLGRLEPGMRYPAHTHAGPEELLVLSGDLHIGGLTLGPGDFHHSDAGTSHEDNHSVEGCTLLAVVPPDHELVQFALAAG